MTDDRVVVELPGGAKGCFASVDDAVAFVARMYRPRKPHAKRSKACRRAHYCPLFLLDAP